MEKIYIEGGQKLVGEITVNTSKNAILPILSACLLTKEKVIIRNYPKIADVYNMAEMLQYLGAKVEFFDKRLEVCCRNVNKYEIPYELSKKLRSSIFLLGSILGRFKRANISHPGGCEIGLRAIDLHIKALKELNVEFSADCGKICCNGQNIIGAICNLDFPSVGATENIILASVLAKGKTTIVNAAKEPEIVDLQNFLNSMGAKISGAGSPTIEILGVKKLNETVWNPISDRIEAGTFLIATALCGGEIQVNNADFEQNSALISKLSQIACKIECKSDKIILCSSGNGNSFGKIETSPYPGFPTDLQSQMMTLASTLVGTSVIVENIFENRFKNANELIKMGADIYTNGKMAVIKGVKQLVGAVVSAGDLRGGAGLVLAGLKAKGLTTIENIHHIDRGYADIEGQLKKLGAKIFRE